MKFLILYFLLLSTIFGDFCPNTTFEDEFEEGDLTSIWSKSSGTTFPTNASLFYADNVTLEKGYLVLSLDLVGVTDKDGVLYRTTGGELVSVENFGYGRYEFRALNSGLDGVVQTIHMVWDDGDYDKHHQFLGFDLGETAYMTLFSTGVFPTDEITIYHTLEGPDEQPEDVDLRPRFLTIEYTPESVVWYFDGVVARTESSSIRELPDKEMKIIFRIWLQEKYQYNVKTSDLPIYFMIDYFKFTPYDDGEAGTCDELDIGDDEEEEDTDAESNSSSTTSTDTDGTVVYDNSGLEAKIETLTYNKNHLLGTSGKIDDLSLFKSARVVWIFLDNEWKAYSPYIKIREILEANGIEVVDEIPAYSGFWIQK
jgi:beta-glucanase (GH16 family)